MEPELKAKLALNQQADAIRERMIMSAVNKMIDQLKGVKDADLIAAKKKNIDIQISLK